MQNTSWRTNAYTWCTNGCLAVVSVTSFDSYDTAVNGDFHQVTKAARGCRALPPTFSHPPTYHSVIHLFFLPYFVYARWKVVIISYRDQHSHTLIHPLPFNTYSHTPGDTPFFSSFLPFFHTMRMHVLGGEWFLSKHLHDQYTFPPSFFTHSHPPYMLLLGGQWFMSRHLLVEQFCLGSRLCQPTHQARARLHKMPLYLL